MKRRHLTLFAASALAGALSFPAAAATAAKPLPRLQSPYLPGSVVQQAFDEAQDWVEVYDVPAARAAEAMALTIDKAQAPEKGLAYLISDKLYVKVAGAEVTLPETQNQVLRKGLPVEYVRTCGTYPMPGDHLSAVYHDAATGYRVDLSVTVVRYLPSVYMELTNTLAPVNPADPQQCEAQTHARIFFKGDMTLSRQGKRLDSRQVLVQSIFEP